jgi:acetyl esterase/lipase
MIRRALLAILLLTGSAAVATMTWPDLLDRPKPRADRTIAYGSDPLQHVDLWLPTGKGPFPTVLMIHGGCWQTDIATADIMNWIADDLRKRGIAVWNVEYRGVDRPGGGYPGTFADVAAAADTLKSSAKTYALDTSRIVAVGHSAGGHLALWSAARDKLPRSAPFYRTHPLPIAAAISLGGLPDLEAARVPPGNTCGSEAVAKLVGTASAGRPDVYADTSPARMAPPSAEITLINGAEDRIAPPVFAQAYQARMTAVGKAVERVTIPASGHVELISPETAAWAATVAKIEAAFRR